MTTVVLVLLGYLVLLGFVLALLRAAARGDEVRDAERVTVILAEGERRDRGPVGACMGAPAFERRRRARTAT